MGKGLKLAIVLLLVTGSLWLMLFLWARSKAEELEASGKMRFFSNALLGKLTNHDGMNDPLEPTGDDLTDLYAKAVLKLLDQLATQNEATTPAVLPEGKLAELEPDFRNDSRYWELRYSCMATAGPNDTGLQHEEGLRDATRFLERVIGEGSTTANTLLLLHFARLSNPVTPVKQGDEMNLLSVAVGMAPDQAWPYYARMLYELELGQNAAALTDLKAGNAAPKLDYPLPFPVSAASKAWMSGGRLGNLQVSGAVSMLERGNVRYHSSNNGPTGSRNIIGNYLKSGTHTLAELNEWLRFATRLSQSEHTTFMNTSIPLIVFSQVHEAGLAQIGLTTDQTENLKRLLGAKETAHSALREFSHNNDQMDAAMQGVARYGLKGIWFNMGKDPEKLIKCYDEKIAPIIADIEQVDLTQHSPAPSLAKYGAVTIAELKQRRDELRAKERAAKEAKQDK